MSFRHLPVRPNLEQLRHQAKELLSSIKAGQPLAVEDLRAFHPENLSPEEVKLADAQLILARSYGSSSWPRLVTACQMTDAIWRGDCDAVRSLIQKDRKLLTEAARGVEDRNWGPPMSYAANVGQDEIITMLQSLGADDLQHAFDRACLQGKIKTAHLLLGMGARPLPGCIMGPCETLNPQGLRLLFELGADMADAEGDPLAPIALLLEIYARNPLGKHGCLDLVEQRGIVLPDTPVMAFHRGRIDLLEKHLSKDPLLLSRTFSHEEIYPPELGCHADHTLALHGTPIADSTLLHLCVDFDEIEIAQWALEMGANVNALAQVDRDGFGGHSALFGCVVSQPYLCGRQKDGAFTLLLLEHGADPNIRASLRKELRFVEDETLHEYRNVTPFGWGQQFHDRDWVNPVAMRLVSEATEG